MEVRTTGCLLQTRVFLEDGATEVVLWTPDGLQAPSLTLYPLARRAGSWRLWAEVLGGDGHVSRTGVVRTVVVQ